MSKYSKEETTVHMDELSSRKGYELKDTTQKKIATLDGNELSAPFDPIQRIEDGFNFFRINEFDKFPEYYSKLAEGQEPKFLMFACSDSRVSPTNILNLRPGEAFMNRTVANLVPEFNQLRYSDIGAVIEYAVRDLKVVVIVIIGHSRCGGIERLLALPDEETSYDFLDDWVSNAQPAKEKVIAENPDASGDELQTLVEKESVRNSLVNLLSYPYVRTGIDEGTLKLLGGYYDFVNGTFEFLQVDLDTKPIINI